VRAVFVVVAAILLSGCSGDKTPVKTDQANSEEILKRDCADAKWKEQNLGLWYSVCRPPLRW